jgi:hypothetical protein
VIVRERRILQPVDRLVEVLDEGDEDRGASQANMSASMVATCRRNLSHVSDPASCTEPSMRCIPRPKRL